jgi:hypothetical protein
MISENTWRKYLMNFSKLIIFLTLAAVLAACAAQPAADTPTTTPDLQSTVNAGIQGTQAAEVLIQATVDSAVAATVSAIPTEEQPSEEELAGEIDQAVNEAAAATEELYSTTEEMAADGQITQEEYDELEALVVDAAVLLDYAEYWIETYDWLYGDLADETLVLLEEVEDLLYYAEDYVDEIALLLEIGTELADATLTQLEDLAVSAGQAAAQLEGKTDNWQTQLQEWQQIRAENALNIEALEVPGNRPEAIRAAQEYAAALLTALEDKVINAAELQNLAQMGANAVAGLEAHGGNALQSLAGSINQLTQQAALGQLNQLAGGLNALEAAIPNR